MVDPVSRREDYVVVAVLADVACLNMRRVLANGLDAVMAAEAAIHNGCMVKGRRDPAERRMAIVTSVRAGDVCGMLAGRCRTVMAGRADADDLRMVNSVKRCKEHTVMAVLADVSCLNVPGILANGFDAVMTADAIARDIEMVEVRREPAIACMTVITSITTGNVCWMFARCDGAIVAGRADADDLGMVYRISRREKHAVMAVLADIAGLEMRRILANGIGAVVTAEAIASDIDVVEVCRDPAIGRVALVAGIPAAYMRRVLARGNRAIVAGRAGADYLVMLDPVRRRKDHVVMAVLANIGGLNVQRTLADRIGTVMTAETIRHDICVLESRRNPAIGCMTVVTIVAATDVRRVLARGNRAVMAR